MRILLIVPDGVGVRNYLYSSFLKELKNEGNQIIVYHQISDSAVEEITSVNKTIDIITRIPKYKESIASRLLRESLAFARILRSIKVFNNPTIMSFWGKNPKKLTEKSLIQAAKSLGRVFASNEKLISWGDSLYEKSVLRNPAISKIKLDLLDFKPDLILNLHQRAPISSPIISIAETLNIVTSTVIFSWDNVPKGRLISRYSKYFVWSDLMKSELHLLYPEIDLDLIEVVGSPQFEFYFQEKYQLSKIEFFSQFGLDLRRKTICFSANDLSSPYEANYLKDVCAEIVKISSESRPQILFRKCPVDKSDRFDRIIENYPDLVYAIDPDWRVENIKDDSFASIYPTRNDLILLVNTVLHSDLVINFGSTMAHDFAVLDKPCLYLNYDPVDNSTFKVSESYNFQHFKSMEGLDAVVWLDSKDQIINKVMDVLDAPQNFAKDRKIWMNRIIQHPLEKSSKLLVGALKSQ